MTEFFNTTGKRVRILRQDLGLTQDEMHRRLVANGARVSRSYVSVIERQETLAGADVLRAMAKVLNTSADYLIMLTDDPSPFRLNLTEEEEEPLSEGVRTVAERLDHLAEPLRSRALEILDQIIKLVKAAEETSVTTAEPEVSSAEDMTPGIKASPLDALIADYMGQLSPEAQRLAVSKAIGLLLAQNSKPNSAETSSDK